MQFRHVPQETIMLVRRYRLACRRDQPLRHVAHQHGASAGRSCARARLPRDRDDRLVETGGQASQNAAFPQLERCPRAGTPTPAWSSRRPNPAVSGHTAARRSQAAPAGRLTCPAHRPASSARTPSPPEQPGQAGQVSPSAASISASRDAGHRPPHITVSATILFPRVVSRCMWCAACGTPFSCQLSVYSITSPVPSPSGQRCRSPMSSPSPGLLCRHVSG